MSITVVDKIKDPAPKWVPPPPKPTFRTDLEKTKYWETEKIRWREGYGDGYSHLCGMHYHYLTQGTLKDGSDGDPIRPSYRDSDEWIIQPIHEAFWSLKNHVGLIKRREIGATSIGAGLLPSYSMRMFPNSTFGATSCDQARIFKAFSDKTDVFIKKLDADIRPVFDRTVGFKENATKQQVYWKLPWVVKDPITGQSDYAYSELFARETSDTPESAKAFSSARLRAAYIDEFPLHKRKGPLLGSIGSCVMKGPDQSGLLFWAGTVEEGITPEQINELQKLVRQSEILRFNVIFAAAWWGLFMNKNGVSDEKKGTQWVMEERERLDKLEDKTFLKNFIKNYPLSLEEIFELGGTGRFDEFAVQAINNQKEQIDLKTEPIIQYNIRVTGGETKSEPTNKGDIFILEEPKPNVDYIFGYDGIATSKLTSADNANSKLALVGMKGIDPQSDLQFAPVCKYSERPRSIEFANKKCVDIIRHYHKFGRAKIIGELNAAGEHMIQLLINNGLSDTIMYRKDLSKKGMVDTKKLWFYRNDKILDWQNEALNIYYKNYAHMVWFRSVLEDAGKADNDNKDEEDALKAALYGWGTGDLFGAPVKVNKPKKIMIIVGWQDGSPIWEERMV
jgi:hypothetical protein